MMNVDTDKIIPAKWLKTIQRTGLGGALFEAMRYLEDGSEHPEFILNREPWRNAQILIAGDNFGCGSSARARALGAARLRHPLRDRPQLRRHLLQQLLQERHPADRARQGRGRPADPRGRDRDRSHLHGRPRAAPDPPADGQRADPVRPRSDAPAQAAQRPRRHRPDPAAGRPDRRLRARAEGWLPLALPGRSPDAFRRRYCSAKIASYSSSGPAGLPLAISVARLCSWAERSTA